MQRMSACLWCSAVRVPHECLLRKYFSPDSLQACAGVLRVDACHSAQPEARMVLGGECCAGAPCPPAARRLAAACHSGPPPRGRGRLPAHPASLSHLHSCGEAALPQGGTPRAAIHLSLDIVLAPLQRQYNLNTTETKIISSLI